MRPEDDVRKKTQRDSEIWGRLSELQSNYSALDSDVKGVKHAVDLILQRIDTLSTTFNDGRRTNWSVIFAAMALVVSAGVVLLDLTVDPMQLRLAETRLELSEFEKESGEEIRREVSETELAVRREFDALASAVGRAADIADRQQQELAAIDSRLAVAESKVGDHELFTRRDYETLTIPEIHWLRDQVKTLRENSAADRVHQVYMQDHMKESDHPHGVLAEINALRAELGIIKSELWGRAAE